MTKSKQASGHVKGPSRSERELRQRAEEIARENAVRSNRDLKVLSPEEMRQTLHELRVHQIELEMQNEELRRAQVELDAGRARYFDLYELAPVGYLTLSEQGLIREANLRAAQMLGAPRSALIKKPISHFILKEDQDIYYLHRKGLFETGEPQQCEMRMSRGDGTVVWARLEANAAQDADGSPVCRVVMSDISEHKRSEGEIQRLLALVQQERTRLAAVIDSIADEVWFADTQKQFALANPSARREFGLSPDDVIDVETLAKSQEVLRPDGTPRPVDEAPPLRALLGEVVRNQEEIVRTPATGELRHRQVSSTPVRDAEGAIIGSVSVVRDVTEKRRAEEALRESEAKYRLLIETTSQSVVVLQDGLLQFVNPAGLEAMGVQSERELVGKPFCDFVHPDDRSMVLESYQRRLESEASLPPYVFRATTPGGVVKWVEVGGARIEWQGKPATLNFLTDVTERRRAEEALRESRQIIEGILNAMPVRVFWKDNNLVYLGGNAMFAHDAGLADPRDLVGKDDYQLGWRDRAEHYRSDDRQVIESGSPKFLIEEEQTTPQGSTITILTSKIPLRDSEGEISGVLGTYMDITARKQAEEALRESEEKYRLLIETASEAIMVDQDGLVKFANPMLLGLMGARSEEQVIDRPYIEFIHPDDRSIVVENDRRRKAGEAVVPRFSLRMLTGDGSVRYAEVNIATIEWHGRPAALTFLTDITERKQAEEALRESEEKYRLLIDTTNESVVVAQDGLLRFANPATRDLMGVQSEQELIGRPFSEFIHPDDRSMVGESHRRRLANEAAGPQYAFRVVTREGVVKWVEINAARIEWQGNPATLNFLSDITERKQAEQALKQSEEKYRALFEHMEAASCLDEVIYENGKAVDYRILDINPSFESIAGVDRTQAVGMLASRVYGQEPVPFLDIYSRVAETGESATFEAFFPPMGKYLHITASCPGTGRFSTVFTDITERKRAEEKIAAQLDELRRWQDVMLGREDRVQELKSEVNELSRRAGETPRYPSQEADPTDSETMEPGP